MRRPMATKATGSSLQRLGEAAWEPFSRLAGRLLAPAGPGVAAGVSNVAWWVHNLVVLAFLNLLPLSKHFHIITSVPNVFFKKLEPTGALAKQDLENATRFGSSHIDHFTWKQVLDMFTCTECGRCSSQCPATATGKPLAPRQLLLDLRDYLYQHQVRATHVRQQTPESQPLAKWSSARSAQARMPRPRFPILSH